MTCAVEISGWTSVPAWRRDPVPDWTVVANQDQILFMSATLAGDNDTHEALGNL